MTPEWMRRGSNASVLMERGTTLSEKMNQEMSRGLVEVLGLDSEPVAITYADDPDPEGGRGGRYVCVAVKHAFKGKTVNLSRKSIVCVGGVHWLGFMDLEEMLVAFLVWLEQSFADSDACRRWFRSTPTPPFGKAEYVVLKPLGQCEGTPDLVALLVNAGQAEAVQGLLTFRDAEFIMPQRFASTCQGTITNPLATGAPSFCLPDAVSRKFARFSDNDIIISMPYRFAEEMANNIDGWDVDIDALFRQIVDLNRGGGVPEGDGGTQTPPALK